MSNQLFLLEERSQPVSLLVAGPTWTMLYCVSACTARRRPPQPSLVTPAALLPSPAARSPWPAPASAALPHRTVTSQLSPCPPSPPHSQGPCGERPVLVPLPAASSRWGHPGTPMLGQTNVWQPHTWGAGSKLLLHRRPGDLDSFQTNDLQSAWRL